MQGFNPGFGPVFRRESVRFTSKKFSTNASNPMRVSVVIKVEEHV